MGDDHLWLTIVSRYYLITALGTGVIQVLRRIVFAITWFLIGSIAVTAFILAGHKAGYIVVFPSSEQHVEILAVLLAAATLIIAAVAMAIAIGAVVGYTALKEAAIAAGSAAGDRAARELLTPMIQRDAIMTTGRQADEKTEELTTALSEGRDGDGSPSSD